MLLGQQIKILWANAPQNYSNTASTDLYVSLKKYGRLAVKKAPATVGIATTIGLIRSPAATLRTTPPRKPSVAITASTSGFGNCDRLFD